MDKVKKFKVITTACTPLGTIIDEPEVMTEEQLRDYIDIVRSPNSSYIRFSNKSGDIVILKDNLIKNSYFEIHREEIHED